MHLRIDTTNPSGTRGLTTDLEKIKLNIEQISAIKGNIMKLKSTSREAFSTSTVFGRWLVVYQANVSNDDGTLMHFIDFRIELSNEVDLKIFSQETLNALLTLQHRYDDVYNEQMNTVELSFA